MVLVEIDEALVRGDTDQSERIVRFAQRDAGARIVGAGRVEVALFGRRRSPAEVGLAELGRVAAPFEQYDRIGEHLRGAREIVAADRDRADAVEDACAQHRQCRRRRFVEQRIEARTRRVEPAAAEVDLGQTQAHLGRLLLGRGGLRDQGARAFRIVGEHRGVDAPDQERIDGRVVARRRRRHAECDEQFVAGQARSTGGIARHCLDVVALTAVGRAIQRHTPLFRCVTLHLRSHEQARREYGAQLITAISVVRLQQRDDIFARHARHARTSQAARDHFHRAEAQPAPVACRFDLSRQHSDGKRCAGPRRCRRRVFEPTPDRKRQREHCDCEQGTDHGPSCPVRRSRWRWRRRLGEYRRRAVPARCIAIAYCRVAPPSDSRSVESCAGCAALPRHRQVRGECAARSVRAVSLMSVLPHTAATSSSRPTARSRRSSR